MHRFLAVGVVLLSCAAFASAAPATAPTSRPTVASITDVLDRVRAHLDAGVGARLVDPKTSEQVTDLSTEEAREIAFEKGTSPRFGPYSYPMGVVYSGMIAAREATGDTRFGDFVMRRFQVFADNLPKVEKWSPEDQKKSPFRNMLKPGSLDACGAMGTAMCQARRTNIGPDLKWVIDRFAEYVTRGQFRLQDGTLARKRPAPASVWADDAYMGIPILAEMGKLTGERSYFDDAARQMKQMAGYLFVADKGLYTHGWTQDKPASAQKHYWARANGWCMMAIAELLDVLPEDHPARGDLIGQMRAHAKGLAAVQDESGLWHQLLDRPDSYLETSASAMFTMGMARGINRGWLDRATYQPIVEKAWNGLAVKVTSDGRVEGTCIGTNYKDDDDYYLKRPATDDIHGYGPLLLAGAEMIKLEQRDESRASARLRIDSLEGPVTPEEIASFKAYMRSIPPPKNNHHNALVYGAGGGNVEALGLMYEATNDREILEMMLASAEHLLAVRNDPRSGRVLWTGQRELTWPNKDEAAKDAKSTGTENGDVIAHIAYGALLALKSKDPTLRDRAVTLVRECDRTIDSFILPWLVDKQTNCYHFPDSAEWGALDPHNERGRGKDVPWNQQWMLNGGFQRLAECHELLGDDPPRVARYDAIVKASIDFFLSELTAYDVNGHQCFKWSYGPENHSLRHVEDTGHGGYDILIYRAYVSGRYGISRETMQAFADTVQYAIAKSDGRFAIRVDGSGEPRNYLGGTWMYLAEIAPDLYPIIAKADLERAKTNPRLAAHILWAKHNRWLRSQRSGK